MYADLDLTPLRKEILPVWECALKNLDDSLKDCVQSLINWIGSEKSLYHRVLRGEALRPNQPISQLTDAILKYHGCDLKSDHNWLIILRQVINAGNELQKWNLELPAHSIVSPRERGRFNPDRFRSRKLAKIWKCALDKSFSRVDNLNHDQSIGRIMLSAMLYGGITNPQLLISLIKNIPLKPTYHNGFRFIDLKPTWRGQDIAEVRRWFPDPLTETLMLRFRNNINLDSEHKISGPWVHKKVNSFLKECDVSKENLPSGISQLCDISCIQYELNFPPVIADYCARRFLGHSLRDCAWSRMSGPVEKINDVEPLELSGWHKTQKLDEVNNESHPFKHVAFIGIREAIYSEKIQVASTQLKHHIATLDATSHSLEYLFSSWILYLFKPRNGNRAIKTSTARNYLSIIGSRLDEALSGESLVELSSDEFEEAYTLILDAIDSQNHKRRVAKTLYQFHRYVEKYHDITRIDYHGVLGSYSAPMPVDANVLWVDEFERIQASIRQSDLIQMHPDLVDVINLIFTLGYRCGLRRMEALRLRLIDVSGTYKPELLVRPFLGRRLKTNSSLFLL